MICALQTRASQRSCRLSEQQAPLSAISGITAVASAQTLPYNSKHVVPF